MTLRTAGWHRRAAIVAGALAALGTAGPATGASARTPARGSHQVVLSPRPGATVRRNTVRIAIRAGAEYNDVDARLNGQEIGGQFGRFGASLRVLVASDSDGLRYGTNVLRVVAHQGFTISRMVVRFRVTTPRLLVGAGRTVYAPIGVPVHIGGLIRPQTAGTDPTGTRWTLISAPARSRFARSRAARVAAATRSAAGRPPVTSVDDPLTRRGAADDPMTSFTPDVLGPYRLKLTSAVGRDVVSNEVTVEATPDKPTVLIDTEASKDGTPGVALNGDVLTAPPLARDPAGKPLYAGLTKTGIDYFALWQIVAVDRYTLDPVWNRTYGWCNVAGTFDYSFCRLEDGHSQPVTANVRQDLEALGSGDMVIVSSHPARTDRRGSAYWGVPSAASLPDVLRPIGAPDDPHLLHGATAGGVSAIGVPGSAPGSANVSVVSGGDGAMQGYLGTDPNKHFAFMPAARVPFDSRSSDACSQYACTITQTVGDQVSTASVSPGDAGYLVSEYDPHTLKLAGHDVFPLVGGGVGPVSEITNFLTKAAAAGNVILVTMYRTAGAQDGRSLAGYDNSQTTGDWRGLANEIAAIGGTENGFNLTAASRTSLYSLVGWGGAGVGGGVETTSGDGRLRGALAPDRLSLFRPVDVNADGAPAEQLIQIMLRKPVTSWPLDNNPAAHRALAWLGEQVHLGTNPRVAYWNADNDQSTYNHITDELRHIAYPAGKDFTEADFNLARDELIKEIGWVGVVRDYLGKLAKPESDSRSVAWQEATTVNNKLTAELQSLKEKAEVQFSWTNLAASIGDIVAEGLGVAEFEKLAKFAEVLASTTLLSGEVYDKTWNGGPANDAERTVEADQLAAEIQGESDRQVEAYQRMGDMIVSDPTKLEEVGTWAGCEPAGNGCDGTRYAEFALPSGAGQAAYATAVRGIDRVVYERLVPLAFEVWNTGVAHDPDPARFFCGLHADDPFQPDTPTEAYTSTLVGLDPNHPGDRSVTTDNEWDTYMLVHRDGSVYSWPSKEVLDRMYGPVSASDIPTEGGLGIAPQDYVPSAKPSYVPGGAVFCRWDNTRASIGVAQGARRHAPR